jgi:hypothetical protein
MAEYQVGDLVWVKTGEKNEVTGTVLEVDCVDDSDDEGEESMRIQVRLDVSNYKMRCSPSELRRLEGDESSARRSSRRLVVATQMMKNRAAVTPSPKSSKDSNSTEDTEGVEDSDEDGEQEDQETLSEEDKKPAAKRKKSVLESTVDTAASAAKRSKAAGKEKPAEPASPYFNKKRSSEAIGKEQNLIIPAQSDNVSDDDSESNVVSVAAAVNNESSGEDGEDEDHPFQIDYAPTSRATCRRCDEVILKGAVRVAHAPLFRGKPGFRVFRHLRCSVFSKEVERAEDVGGWRELARADYEALAARVEESKIEVQQENEELNPDELVQVAFQGETRRPPPGLEASLLPFQVEGLSWMYHQEFHVDTIRGGILVRVPMMITSPIDSTLLPRLEWLSHLLSCSLLQADEMGMVNMVCRCLGC